MNRLRVIVQVEYWDRPAMAPGPLLPKRAITVVIKFIIRNGAHHVVREIDIVMEATNRHQDENQLRDELIQSARADHRWPANNELDKGDDWAMDIVDPHGILEWFGINNAFDLFKQKQNNDKPVRLPAPPVK